MTDHIPADNATNANAGKIYRFRMTDYGTLLKPRVMSLVVFTALTGLLLAPTQPDLLTGGLAILCIAVGAGASGAINMWYDRDIDAEMIRTKNRPIPAGTMNPVFALWYGAILSVISVAVMAYWVNTPAAGLLALTILYYVFFYTMWLKRRTPQNIVIGGAAGAFPPMIGWVAATGDIGLGAVVLFAIIFLWTPPHTWALALYRNEDYARVNVPMMPVVVGARRTKVQMVAYMVLTVTATLMPPVIGMSGWLYTVMAVFLGLGFGYHMRRVWKDQSEDSTATARPMFFFSILYLFLIFAFLLLDRAFYVSVAL